LKLPVNILKMGISARKAAVTSSLREKKQHASAAFKSWEGFKRWARVPETALDEHNTNKGGMTWSNVDLDPTPPERRNWAWYNYFVFYFVLGFGNWTLGSTMVGIGLNWWQSILTIFLSQLISSIAVSFTTWLRVVHKDLAPILTDRYEAAC
jgi:nucleobase:cation symporter-1, NCS1 family